MWVLAMGCAPPGPAHPCDSGSTAQELSCLEEALVVEVGASEYGFVPLGLEPPGGAPIQLTRSPTGDWYVAAAVRLHGSTPEVKLLPIVRRVDTGEIIAGALEPSYEALAWFEHCSGATWGIRAFMGLAGVDRATCAFDGLELEVEVTVEELTHPELGEGPGEVVSARAYGVAVLDRDDIEGCSAAPP
jgi:hypothetical protein